jgi:hypothetical protein
LWMISSRLSGTPPMTQMSWGFMRVLIVSLATTWYAPLWVRCVVS